MRLRNEADGSSRQWSETERERERDRDFVAQRSGEVIEEGKEEGGGGGESDPNSLALAREAKR